jgi:hypothetical protein
MAMKAKVTDEGVVIPRKLLEGAEEVEIHEGRGVIVVVPVPPEDPIYKPGANPVACHAPDASANLDQYLYAAKE